MKYFPAGAEFIPSIHAAMITYAERALLTAYPFLGGNHSTSVMTYLLDGLKGRPLILDSGMFSIRQRVLKTGTLTRNKVIERYFDRYIKLIHDSGFTGMVVEADCHEYCSDWKNLLAKFRGVLDKEFGDRVLYAWHPFSGLDDFVPLCKEKRHVAFRMDALCEYTGKDKETAFKCLMSRVKDIEKRVHFHLFAESTPFALRLPHSNTCDSTTWSMIVRYGRAFPHTQFAVFWWRRDKLEAPKVVTDIVDAKRKELYKNYWNSPMSSRDKPEPKYTYALACALVASQLHAKSFDKRVRGKSMVKNEFIQEESNGDKNGCGRKCYETEKTGEEDRCVEEEGRKREGAARGR